ncbi:putative metal homeostasis protein bsd1 [Vanrija pseudolonga]|uniref:Metal homeostasis protein bsd1 n=1 Tax=Vanrija pseudolonga TaxID=143232 RepID=A0AAF0YC70_9TREE|nr:putative metal homeostasis protein bsd1 [Vanrija pseudolonga]
MSLSRTNSLFGRRSSSGSTARHSRLRSEIPDPAEMDAAFDGPHDDDDHDDAQEDHHLLANNSRSQEHRAVMPGDYDFDRDYFLGPPPGSPPPFEPYSATNPAPGNTNGVIPASSSVQRPARRHFLGGILPLSFLPTRAPRQGPAVGGGQSGVFANLSARPENRTVRQGGEDGPEFANEDEMKDAPPSYQTALRDAVPPYWDTTVVLPAASSPFGPLHSSVNGDEILIDGMAAGNFFGFIWNLVVSGAFQFVGFLLTYVLHTTHAAKYGSRAGLGVTLVQFGFKLRSEALKLQKDGHFKGDLDIVDEATGKTQADLNAENILATYTNLRWPQPVPIPAAWGGNGSQTLMFNSVQHLEDYAHAHNGTLQDILPGMNPIDVGKANEWFSLMLMTIGFFLLLASIGGWWRVKRFESKLKAAQRESERAQAEARGDVELDGADVEEIDTRREPGPREMAYYTAAFTQAMNGMRELQRGFLGERGRRDGPERGDTLFNEDDAEAELLQAQGYGLEPMANNAPSHGRGLWGSH